MVEQRAVRIHTPISIKGNLRCRRCGSYAGARRNRALDFEQCLQVVDQRYKFIMESAATAEAEQLDL